MKTRGQPQKGWESTIKGLEQLLHWLRTAPPEQFEGVTVHFGIKRKIPKHKRPLWIEQKALQIFRAEKAERKTNDQATRAVNNALAHLRLDVKIRDGKVAIEDTGPPTFSTRALVALNDRDRNAARRKATKRLKTTPY